jgi:hypothetical protein
MKSKKIRTFQERASKEQKYAEILQKWW